MDGAANKLKLNGWQRLWIVICLAWFVFDWLTVDPDVQSLLNADGETLLFVAATFLVPPIALYVIGMIGAWVVTGFRGKKDM